ncbi:MAG: SGNH/GDSL hydrolase family protein [Firmicutes bacterium]|nr:SGNH/GDSL hydrolase family protein [Bacillota bacterium]
MIYLALGDSITHGYDSTALERRYVDVLTRKLNRLRRTSTYVHAKPGWTSAQLLRSLDRIPECILQEAELVTLMIGGNDLLKEFPWFLDDPDEAMERLRRSFHPKVDEILGIAVKNPSAKVVLCTVYNPFPKAEVAQMAVTGINSLLKEIAQSRGCLLAPVDAMYGGQEERLVSGFRRGELQDFRLLRNPIHPNDAGHERIAEAIFQTYRKALPKAAQGRVISRKKRASGSRQHAARSV